MKSPGSRNTCCCLRIRIRRKGELIATIQVSFDDGKTWPSSHHLLLDEGRALAYPSLTQIDDEHIGIVYEGSQSHLVFERFTLAELLKPAGGVGAKSSSK